MQLNKKLYYYEIANAREQGLVAVNINVDKDLTDILDKMRKWENESECIREEEKALVWKILSYKVSVYWIKEYLIKEFATRTIESATVPF